MAAVPPPRGDLSSIYLAPRLALYVDGTFTPVTDIEVEQTAYGHSDTARATTFIEGSPDYGAMSQAKAHIPYVIKAGVAGDTRLPDQVFSGFLDEIDDTYENDTCDLTARGLLSLLVDKRTTQRADMNTDVGDVIRKLVTSVGLQAQVPRAGVPVGKVLRDDNASMAKNLAIMDYIDTLAAGVGWQTRVVGSTVIVGPPPENVPILTKTWGAGAGTKLSIKHSALHAHNIKVRVVSYLPKKKSTVNSTSGGMSALDLLLLNGNTLNVPAGQIPGNATSPSGGTQSGMAAPKVNDSNVEEYVFHIPGITSQQADYWSAKLQEEISRHEFIAELEWTPDEKEIALLAANSPEFLVQLRGCYRRSANQLYHPRRVTWTWSMTDGLKVNVLMVNHVLPQDTAGQVNSSL